MFIFRWDLSFLSGENPHAIQYEVILSNQSFPFKPNLLPLCDFLTKSFPTLLLCNAKSSLRFLIHSHFTPSLFLLRDAQSVMGSCASAHRNTETDMKFKLSLGSKADKLVIPPSPVKEKPCNANFPIRGSKEETYFDSKPWLDSDGEDDFHSINGEFSPSRGSAPVHHSFGNSDVKKTPSESRDPGSLPEPSPTERKKKLVELFRDKDEVEDEKKSSETQNIGDETEVKTTIQDLLPKSAQSTPYVSGANSLCSSERSMNEDPLAIREKSGKSVQCCLPSLASCRSFSERRRKMSPAIAANGKP